MALAVILACDALWLGVIMRTFYRSHFASIARLSGGSMAPIWPAAASVYTLLSLGIVGFALPLAAGTVPLAAFWGALFGLVIYGFYNLTNYATLARWSAALTAVDIAWGTLLCAIATAAVTVADRWMH